MSCWDNKKSVSDRLRRKTEKMHAHKNAEAQHFAISLQYALFISSFSITRNEERKKIHRCHVQLVNAWAENAFFPPFFCCFFF